MTNTIDQDLIDDAKAAGATMTYACKFRRSEECPCEVKETEECEAKEFYEARLTLEKLAKFAQLQRERQAQPTPSQSEPVAWMYKSSKATDIVEHKFCEETCKHLPKDCVISPLYTKPQTVKDALEQAAKECEEWAQAVEKVGTHKHKEGEIFAYNNAAEAIRALIQTEKGEK